MDIIEEAFKHLFPNREFSFSTKINYSGRYKDYGATIQLGYGKLVLNLSRKWRGVAREIQMGLIQELMVKLFSPKNKKQINTIYIDLYNGFVKNLHKTIPKDKTHPLLRASFDRVNEKYFLGQVELPNLVLGKYATSTFGTYDYKTDTVRISKALIADQELLDYVMYHEMLHKFNSFKSNLGNNRFHTTQFRKHEKVFENSETMERKLQLIASKRYTPGLPKKKKKKSFFERLF